MLFPGGARAASWTAWTWEPTTLLGLALAAAWYARGVQVLWRAAGVGRGVSRGQVAWYAGGLVVIAAALLSPLDAMADDLFAVHMVQHLLLLVIAAPMLVLGSPLAPTLWAVPGSRRRTLGRWWHASPRTRRLVAAGTAPGVVLAAQSAAQWVWHAPAFFQAALGHPVVHAIEHICFLVTAVGFWWCIIQPAGRRRLSYGGAILFLWIALMQGGALGALLIFARSPWYPAYAAGVDAWHTTLLADQQLAGLIMWIPASVVYITAASIMFLRWLRNEDTLDQRTTSASERDIPDHVHHTPPYHSYPSSLQ